MKKRRPDSRRHRRILLWTAAAFFALQFVGGLMLDYVFPQIRFPYLYSVLGWLKSEPRCPDAIILGSSRFIFGLDATELTHEVRAATGHSDFRAFQAAVFGSDGNVMEHTFNKIVGAGHTPRLLIVEMTPQSMAGATSWYRMHVMRQIRWDDSPGHLREIVAAGELGPFLMARVVPLYRHRHEIVKTVRAAAGVFPPLEGTYVPVADVPRSDLSEHDWRNQLAPQPLSTAHAARIRTEIGSVRKEMRGVARTSNALDAFERMFARCQELGIAVVLVGAPVTEPYRETFAPIDALYRENVQRLQVKYGISFFDAHAAIPDHLFQDHHHMSREGSIAFARLLGRQSIAPLWNSLTPALRAEPVSRARQP